ncbi:MAG: DUF362 domain-containing protein [Desulfovermiculus sp.]
MSQKRPSKVFFWPLQASGKAPYALRMRRLYKATNFGSQISSGDLVALKVHLGEHGGMAFLQPQWLIPLVDILRKAGAHPFLSDTNTLYAGHREEAVSHSLLAAMHGFDPLRLGAPVLIADGLKSHNEVSVPGIGHHFQHCYLAGDLLDADAMLNISHFTGHELTGFAGALKSLAMGCASKQGKMHQHCALGPKVSSANCVGCGRCVEVCAPGALALDESGSISLDQAACTGCANCILACKHECLHINWDLDIKNFLERLVEYAGAFLTAFTWPLLHFNFLVQVTPKCDCKSYSDAPLCPDIGVLASYDPVALDQAGLDLVNSAVHKKDPQSADQALDIFQHLHPRTRGEAVLEMAEKLGLGVREYILKTVQ